MSRSVLQPSQQKLAEKLTILNDRGVGMLTRLYNIKKVKAGGAGPVPGSMTPGEERGRGLPGRGARTSRGGGGDTQGGAG